MKFRVAKDELRKQVRPARRVRSEFTQALLDGKTLVVSREDRKQIGGNHTTLRSHGFRLRSGMINDDEVVVWAEKIEDENGTGG